MFALTEMPGVCREIIWYTVSFGQFQEWEYKSIQVVQIIRKGVLRVNVAWEISIQLQKNTDEFSIMHNFLCNKNAKVMDAANECDVGGEKLI